MVEQDALLSAEKIQALQTEAFADDVPIPPDAANWSEDALPSLPSAATGSASKRAVGSSSTPS